MGVGEARVYNEEREITSRVIARLVYGKFLEMLLGALWKRKVRVQ